MFFYRLGIFYKCLYRHFRFTDIITPAKKVIERQIGDRVNGISFQQIDPVNGKETFEIEAKEGKLTLRGSSVVALCYAFHIYQREACHAMTT